MTVKLGELRGKLQRLARQLTIAQDNKQYAHAEQLLADIQRVKEDIEWERKR